MVLVMDGDGSLSPSQSQSSFTRNYNDGVGLGSATDGLTILGEVEDVVAPDEVRVAVIARSVPLPRADVLSAIEATALRYGSHPGLRRARLSITDWVTLFRANTEIESAYRQSAVRHRQLELLNRPNGEDVTDRFANAAAEFKCRAKSTMTFCGAACYQAR